MAIPGDGRVRTKEDEKVENIKFLLEKSKRCGAYGKGDTHSGGDIGDNATEGKRKSEDHRCQHIH